MKNKEIKEQQKIEVSNDFYTLLAAGYTPKRVLIIFESFVKEYRDECKLYNCMDDKKLKIGEKLVNELRKACS